MKANSIGKRVLSLVVIMVMLVSCWVFTAPVAEAATSDHYQIRVYLNGTNGFTGNNVEITVYGKPNNGTGTETSIKTYSVGTGSGSWADKEGTTTTAEYNCGKYWPTKMTDS